MPSREQVRITRAAISPRLAISSRRIRGPHAGRRAPPQQHRVGLGELAVAEAELDHGAADARVHRRHHLHGLDDADDGLLVHLVADLDERRCSRLRRPVEGAEQRRPDGDQPLGHARPAPARLPPAATGAGGRLQRPARARTCCSAVHPAAPSRRTVSDRSASSRCSSSRPLESSTAGRRGRRPGSVPCRSAPRAGACRPAG